MILLPNTRDFSHTMQRDYYGLDLHCARSAAFFLRMYEMSQSKIMAEFSDRLYGNAFFTVTPYDDEKHNPVWCRNKGAPSGQSSVRAQGNEDHVFSPLCSTMTFYRTTLRHPPTNGIQTSDGKPGWIL